MKKTLLLSFLFLFALQLNTTFAQSGTCMPDTTAIDTTGGLGVIFPLPYDETTMTGGIPITACNNQPFELVFTANVPLEVDYQGLLTLSVDSIEITEAGISNLPEGLTYACNPPNCIFEGGTFGCVVVYGTPNDEIADYNLQLNMMLYTDLIDQASVEPGTVFPGTYTLTLEEENSGTCFVVGTSDILQENLQFGAIPNPFSDYTQIRVESGIRQSVFFEVHDLLGNELFVQPIDLQEGRNTIDFDGNGLAEGMYIYSLRKGSEVISKKMIINR